jgi:hypothetical protein
MRKKEQCFYCHKWFSTDDLLEVGMEDNKGNEMVTCKKCDKGYQENPYNL